jgi:intracellular septation protein
MSEMSDQTPAPSTGKSSPARTWLKMAVDYSGPAVSLIVWLKTHDFQLATWWLVGFSVFAIVASFALERRVAILPLIYGAMAMIFGCLTLWFHDKSFIKMKPTVVDFTLGSGMLIGLAMGKSPIRHILGDSLKLSDRSWRALTLRYGIFFYALAVVNLAIWLTQSDQVWFWFRFPGALIIALLFSFTQIPMMMKDAKAFEAAANAADTQQ